MNHWQLSFGYIQQSNALILDRQRILLKNISNAEIFYTYHHKAITLDKNVTYIWTWNKQESGRKMTQNTATYLLMCLLILPLKEPSDRIKIPTWCCYSCGDVARCHTTYSVRCRRPAAPPGWSRSSVWLFPSPPSHTADHWWNHQSLGRGISGNPQGRLNLQTDRHKT